MPSSPLVTIGIPAYNAASTISETLDSVLAQDYKNFVVVVSDNASTDDTPNILADFAQHDPRVRIHRQSKNIGGAANFSTLPRLCATPFFKWQSADDMIAPDYLRKCLAPLQADPAIALAFGSTIMVDENGEYLRHHDDNLHLVHDQPAQRVAAFVRQQWLCNAQFGVVRTQSLLQTDLIRPYPSSDLAMLAQLSAIGKFHHVKDTNFFRRFSSDSMGLGDLSDAQKAAWFATESLERNPQWRAFIETNKGLWRSPLGIVERLQSIAAYDYSRARRAYGRWRYRRRVQAGVEEPVNWSSLFKSAQSNSKTTPKLPLAESTTPADGSTIHKSA